MNLLNKLTLKNLKLNKKRSVVTIIGIILSVALITAVSSMVVSFRKSLIDYEIKKGGNYHYAFGNVPEEDFTYFDDNRNIESYYITQNIGYAKINESQNEGKPYAFILGMNTTSLNNSGLIITEGRLPQNTNEIIIPRHLKTNGRVSYQVGDKITLNIGKRISDNYELDQTNPITEEETLTQTYTKEYEIVGIIERPSGVIEPYTAPGYTFITLFDNNIKNNYNIYARYTKKALKDKDTITSNILGVNPEIIKKGLSPKNEQDYDNYINELEKAKYTNSENKYLINLETMSTNDNGLMRTLTILASIVIVIIIVTSVFCIKNSFNISITEKIKQYGMLASIGATSKQIKKNVYYEAFILGLIGIPFGVLFGIIASYILIIISNYLLEEALVMGLLSFNVSILSIIISILLSIITIYASARKSAKRASKISPIVAIRSNEDIKITSKKISSPKIIKKIFGVSGEVSYKNLKRSRKKYRTTVISIITCVTVYIALSYFINTAFKVVKQEYGEYTYNLSVSLYNNSNEEKNNQIKDIVSLKDIDTYSVLKYTVYEAQNIKNTSERMEYDNEEQISKEENIIIYSVGQAEYQRYLKKLNLTYEEAKDKVILINNNIRAAKEKKIIYNLLDYKPKDKLTGTVDGTNIINLEIVKITDQRPMGLENNYGMSYLITSEEKLQELTNDISTVTILINTTNPDKLQDQIEKLLDENYNEEKYNLVNVDANVKSVNSLYILIAIFLYGFIIVIALIGITNIVNTITTNMELRRSEFATLKSIGMTSKEFNKMIFLESFFYGLKSLLIGIPLGIMLSYLIYLAIIGKMQFKFVLPYKGIIISILLVFILIYSIMKYSIKKINKRNIIETIRNENI